MTREETNELASFSGSIGCWPKAGLTIGNDGDFYGSTSSGGTNGGSGTFFKVSASGNFTPLVSLGGGSPQADLTLASNGSFYGVLNNGTVFNLTTNGQIQSLASITYPNYGSPYSLLNQSPDGAFYGSTYSGYSSGILFKVLTNGFVTNLFSFGGTNGSNPQGGVCFGNDGSLYGTTSSGGSTYSGSGANGSGTVYKLATNGILKTLKVFTGDGALPYAGLCLANDGTLYGTTSSGGGYTNTTFTFGFGEVFKVATNGVVSAVASFNGTNGNWPEANMVAGSDGNLYGTTMLGGFGTSTTNSGLGTIFRVKPKGGITTLISFNRANGTCLPFAGTVSTYPQADLVIGNDGNLYGTTTYGGMGGNGTIFRLLIPPDIAEPPKNQTNAAASIGSFTVAATSLQPLVYQWQKNGINLTDSNNVSGTSTTNLVINGISDSDSGIYSVVVSNSNFGVTNFATLTVIDPPGILAQPQDQRVPLGSSASFNVAVSNMPPLHYQWHLNSTNILNATNAVYTILAVAETNVGNYTVVVTNLAGGVTSSNALLTVILPPQNFSAQSSENGFQLQLTGSPNYPYILQATTNLTPPVNWLPVLTNAADGNGNWQFTDTNLNGSQKFYRAVGQ